ncbi:MAG: alpha/beta fold hydrolase [Acidobacteriota bacterium]
MSDLLPTVERGPENADAAVIWLHGLGADGHDFADIPPLLGLPADLRVRFIFPHAPRMPVTLNHGMVMPAWYDIRSLDERGQDAEGIAASAVRIEALIEREVERGVAHRRIVLGGFSQGGAVALHTSLRHANRLAGVMVLSAYLLLADRLESEASPANRDLPVFQAHGTFDPMVPYAYGTQSRDRLVASGWNVAWHEYPMAHQVCQEEIEAIGQWFVSILAD